MTITPQQAQKILTGNYVSSQLGFSLLLTRLKGLYSKEPTQAVLQQCTTEINAFFTKFHAVMEKDYSIISKM